MAKFKDTENGHTSRALQHAGGRRPLGHGLLRSCEPPGKPSGSVGDPGESTSPVRANISLSQ